MPPPLPDRYHLELRLGRDRDTEEWLATDRPLDRPVLIRILGPETTTERRSSFLAAVRGAAGVAHVHLVAVYAASEVEGGAYSVTEWTGGVSLQNRLDAGETITPKEFLTNAAGLAGALAALHDAGVIHGAIDPSAVRYATAHPAKLGALGRPPIDTSTRSDVAALARTLELALTGTSPPSAPPSELVDGISSAVDVALDAARNGSLDAHALEAALQAAPSVSSPTTRGSWSWRWLAPASLLLLLGVGVVALGLLLSSGSNAPTALPSTTTTASVPTSAVQPPSTPVTSAEGGPEAGTVAVLGAQAFDPFGTGGEHDEKVGRVIDGDPSTTWRTERYYDPLPRIKEGVGIVVEVAGSPSRMIVENISDGTVFTVLWAPQPLTTFEGWERITGGTVTGETISVQLPSRDGGAWLLWLTDLPQQDDGYFTSVGEIEFRP